MREKDEFATVPERSRRSRTISIRISEAEYEVLKAQCRNIGARSVSDLTRLAIHRVTEDHTFEASVGSSLQTLNTRISELEQKLELLGADGGDPARQGRKASKATG